MPMIVSGTPVPKIIPDIAPTPLPHSRLDDIQGFVIGTVFVSLGLTLFAANGQVSGGTAGIAILFHYASGQSLSIGAMFALANLPFFWLAIRRMGRRFALRSLVAVVMVSALTHVAPQLIRFEAIAPAYSALAGGLLTGMGVLAFVRHGASIGGVNILGVYLQQTRGISAGRVQFCTDLLVLLVSLVWLSPEQFAYSVLGAAMIGTVLAMNHKPGRYTGY